MNTEHEVQTVEFENPGEIELLWRQYEQLVELYKFYLNVVIQTNVLIFAITGGIATYVLDRTDTAAARWSLILPILLSAAFAVAAALSSRLSLALKSQIVTLQRQLNIGLVPHVEILTYGLLAFALIHATLALFISVLFLHFDQLLVS